MGEGGHTHAVTVCVYRNATGRDGEGRRLREKRGRAHTAVTVCVYRNVTGKPTPFIEQTSTKYNFKRKERQGCT